MNYIKEINAFYDRLELNSLSSSAIALWHALMHINNKAAWTTEFTVALSVLSVKSGLSERTISNARNELKQKGYIDFKSRKGNKSALYKLNSLLAIDADNFSIKNDLSANIADNVSDKLSDNTSSNVSDKLSTLNKHKRKQKLKLKLNNDNNNPVNVYRFYENEGFGTISGFSKDLLDDLVDNYSEAWLIEAMKKAVVLGKRNLGYVEGILKNWRANGIDNDQAKDRGDSAEKSNDGDGVYNFGF